MTQLNKKGGLGGDFNEDEDHLLQHDSIEEHQKSQESVLFGPDEDPDMTIYFPDGESLLEHLVHLEEDNLFKINVV